MRGPLFIINAPFCQVVSLVFVEIVKSLINRHYEIA